MRPVTLITGASAGIGAELARVFAEHGHEVGLLQRRPELVRMADRDDRRADADAEESRRQAAGPEAS